MHRGDDAGAQEGRPGQCGEAPRPHGHDGAKGHNAEEHDGQDDQYVPFELGLVLRREAQQEDDERALGNDEAYTGEIKKNILQCDDEGDVARGQGCRQLTAEAVIGVERDEAIVREKKRLDDRTVSFWSPASVSRAGDLQRRYCKGSLRRHRIEEF